MSAANAFWRQRLRLNFVVKMDPCLRRGDARTFAWAESVFAGVPVGLAWWVCRYACAEATAKSKRLSRHRVIPA